MTGGLLPSPVSGGPRAEWLREPIEEEAHAWCADCSWLASGTRSHRSAWYHSVEHMSDPHIHIVHLWRPDDPQPVDNPVEGTTDGV